MPLPQGYQLETPDPESGVPNGYKLETAATPDLAHQEGIGDFFNGAWNNVRNLGSMAARLIVPPQDTRGKIAGLALGPAGPLLSDMAMAHVDQGKQAYDAYQKGDYSRAALHGMGAVVPGLGPMVAGLAEKAVSGHPIEALGEGLGALALPSAIKGAGRLAGAAADAAATSSIPRMLRESAQTDYSRVLNATKGGNKLRSAKVVPQLIERGIVSPTLKALGEKIAAGKEAAGQAIGDAFDALPDGTTVPLEPILQKLHEIATKKLTVDVGNGKVIPKSAVAQRGMQHVQGIMDTLRDAGTPDLETGELNIPVEPLRALRQHFDETAKMAGRYDGKNLPDPSEAAAHGMAADAVRGQLADQFPQITPLNKEYGFMSDADRVIQDTLKRREGQAKPLGVKLLRVGGAVIGGAHGPLGFIAGGAGAGMLENLFTSPAWRTVSAVAKDRLANALTKGQRGPIEFEIGKIAKQVQNSEEGGILSPNETQPQVQGQGQTDAGTTGARPAIPVATESVTGAPQTNQTSVVVPGDPTTYNAKYKLRELADIQASHNGLTFNPNPNYALKNDRDYSNAVNQGKIINGSGPQFDPRYHITDNPDSSNGPPVLDKDGNVLGGNGRTMMLHRVYGSRNPANAQSYRSLLEQKSPQFGVDPEQVRGMKQPVLTREIDDSHINSANAVTDFNKTGTAALTPAERSIADAKRVSTGTFDHLGARLDSIGPDATIAQALEGQHGADMLKKLTADGVISPQETAALADADGLTKAGKDRIQGLILGRFFRDPKQLDRIADSVKNKVAAIAGPLVKAEGFPEWNLTEKMKDALDLIDKVKSSGGKNISDYLNQSSLFGKQEFSPQTVQLAQRLQSMTQNQLRGAMKQYASDADYAAQGPGLMGNAPTQQRSFADAFSKPKP